jgi:hypothetical protein
MQKRIYHKSRRQHYRPDLFDWAREVERRSAGHQIRWVARHCRVSLATAATLAANAGLSNREGD